MVHECRSNKEILELLEKTASCHDTELQSFDFEQIGGNDELTFENCIVKGSKIKGDVLVASQWKSCLFENCEFVGAELREIQFIKCKFFDSENASGTEFRFCNLDHAKFLECNISLSKFDGCNSYESSFKGCMMRGCQFKNTDFSREMGKITVNNAEFLNCELTDSTFSGLNLNSCVFKHCNLTTSNFSHALLENAVLNHCDLGFIEVRSADFSQADLRESSLDGFLLRDLQSYAGMKVSDLQQHHLLGGLSIDVYPDDSV